MITAGSDEKPIVALLPWGDVIEDFLEGIGVSLEVFATEMTGGWLFGYVEALRRAGVETVLICISAHVLKPTRYTHGPTGMTVWVLPVPKAYLRLRRRMKSPYGWTLDEMFGEARGLRRVRNQTIRDLATYLATPPRLLAHTLRHERCTAILCQEYEYPRFDVCVAVGKRLGLPVFATFQGGDWQSSRLERMVRPRALKACAGLVIATSTERARVRERYGVPDAKIASIFNPIDLREWGTADPLRTRAELGIPDRARVVVWHGRVDMHRKGLDVLLDAWAEVARPRPEDEVRLLLVGTGSSADTLRERLASEALRSVTWIDEYVLDRTRLRDYLATADVYAFPSRHEGFPVALVEAMAAGLPVVAADAPGVPDILETDEGKGGIMVPRGDVSALAAALDRLIQDPTLAVRLGQGARRRAEQAFSLDVVGRQLRAFFLTAWRRRP